MPSYYVHIRAAAEMLQQLQANRPKDSPLSQEDAENLFEAGHTWQNYLAAGAFGPDLFFLLPDFKGDVGSGLLGLVKFMLDNWKVIDDKFVEPWEQYMTPVLDETSNLQNGITGGMLGEVGDALNLAGDALSELGLGILGQMVDVFGMLSSACQTGYEDSGFFWSDMFHYRKTYQFARTLYRNALAADTSEDGERAKKEQAFALGWISHCATDVAGHPFTNAKCGGPYRTHWQRHHLIENHMDAHVYQWQHEDPEACYGSLVTSAMHFALAFAEGSPNNDAPLPQCDYFPSGSFPGYRQGQNLTDRQARKLNFDKDTAEFPDHICDLLARTMHEVYTGEDDLGGPHVLWWERDRAIGMGGRPSFEVMKEMYELVFAYVKFVTSSGIGKEKPRPPQLITDHDFPEPPGSGADDSDGADPNRQHDLDFVDILLAIVAALIWLADVVIWAVTVLPSYLVDLATWPLRELLYYILVMPAWQLYMSCRSLLVLEGFLTPRPEEISEGLVRLGAGDNGPLVQLRGDLNSASGFVSGGPEAAWVQPSGMDPTLGAKTRGFSLDPAYPRAMLSDLKDPWNAGASADADMVASEFVAPWRYPDHNMLGMRNGWECPRTHVGPYRLGDAAEVLMGQLPGSDAARAQYEKAKTPADSENAAASLMSTAEAHLGDPIDYGVYLIGRLTGHDDGDPVPDFNLDSDRGYGYHCWDYLRHELSTPPFPRSDRDKMYPDQWLCVPADMYNWFGSEKPQVVRDWYGYHEPLTVPVRYNPQDNPHHLTAYDPLERLAHRYLNGASGSPDAADDLDLWVTDAEIREVGMSPTGRMLDK
jgi:hypothetical protein